MYAGFWRRLAAWMLDSVIVLVMFIALGLFMSVFSNPWLVLLLLVCFLAAPWLYYASMESSARQATLGKAATGIRVTNLAGERVTFARPTGRYFGKIVSGLILSIGFVMAGFTDRRQALHDKMADTLVVRNGFTPAEIADAPPAPTPSFMSAVVLGLFVILAGPFAMGVVAGITIPAYQDYSIRAQVAEGLTDALPAKAAIADALANDDDLSQMQDDGTFTSNSQFVSAIENRDGVIVITFGGQAHEGIANKSVELVPGLVEQTNEIVWRCGYASGAAGAQFLADSPGQFTSLPPKYLPQNCR